MKDSHALINLIQIIKFISACEYNKFLQLC